MNKPTNKWFSYDGFDDVTVEIGDQLEKIAFRLAETVTDIGVYDLIERQQASGAAKPAYTTGQIIHQLTTSWGNGDTSQRLWAASTATPTLPKTDISFGINTANPTNFAAFGFPLSSEGNGLVGMTAIQVATARLSFQLWDNLILSSLVESGGAGANITLNYSNATDDDGTYASALIYNTTPKNIAAEQIWLSSNWGTNGDSGMVNGGYGFTTMIHEIGHALGLSHPGAYNAAPGVSITYENNAEFAQDNRQNTIMSYFGGYNPSTNTWAQDGTFTSYKYSQTPMVYDIAAIQALYGADTTTRTGDTVYGYNTTVTGTEKAIYDFLTNTVPIFTIWDAGGSNDALDGSGWNGNQTIDLMPGNFSSVRGLNNNVAIAFNTLIERAFGGTGNDTLLGNDTDNLFHGGAGNDTINGLIGNDTAICGTWATCWVTGNSTSATVTDSSGTDTLTSIEYLTFDGVTVTTEAAVNDAPVGVADDNSTDPVVEAGTVVTGDSSASGNVLTNDTDADSILGLGETKAVNAVNNQTSNVGVAVAGLYGSLMLSANGTYTYTLDDNNPATDALAAGQIVQDNFTYTVVDAHGATSAPTTLAISITGSSDAVVNTPPTLTSFAGAVASGNEDSETAVSFDGLKAQGDEADIDGSVTAFIVKAVSGGSLKIGASAATATAWDAANNATVDAAHTAYWTPAANANGTLPAFTAVARDNGGLESATPVQASVSVSPVNDAPILAAPQTIQYTDTVYDDNFAIAAGTLVATDGDSGSLSFGISGGSDNGDGTVSKTSAYGVLTVTKATGAYQFVADDAAIEPLTAQVDIGFTVTVSDGLLGNSQTLGVAIAQQGSTESNAKDKLLGSNANDIFDALAGNDFINGKAGADIMRGGLGNDTYIVDNANDQVIETSSLTNEIDLVLSAISYTLDDHVENLRLTQSAPVSGTGNGLNNFLTGNKGDNWLDGLAGADKMKGGLGNDTYVVDNKGDRVRETSSLTTEIDQVESSVSFTLKANIENLTLTGSAPIKGIGNGLDNFLVGNSAANRLIGGDGADTVMGGAGNDLLLGGAGNDVLEGGEGLDKFRFNTSLTANVDEIIDFSVTDDKIQLDNAIFSQFPKTGKLNVDNFVLGAAAVDGDDYILYDAGTGVLAYDADGNGTGVAEQIALLTGGVTLSHQDIFIV